MSFDRQAARAFFGSADTTPDRTERRPTDASDPRGRSISEGNAVNPGIDEHGDLYARMSREPRHSAAVPVLVGLALIAGVSVILLTQMGDRINAEDIAAPSVSTSVTNSAPTTAP